jgi:hypothetical protein
MGGSTPKTRPTTPLTVRTKRDRIMIIIGVALVLLFLLAAYVSIDLGGRKTRPKHRGPVRNPKVSSVTFPGFGLGRLMSQLEART